MTQSITRRTFLKLSASALALAALPPLPLPPDDRAARPERRLGRVTTWHAGIHSAPDPKAPEVDWRRTDDIVNILSEVEGIGHYTHNPIWYQIVGGYIYSSWVQPVEYRFNQPVTHVEPPGTLAWVTVPYTDARAQPNAALPRRYRLYYDSVFRVVDVRIVRQGELSAAAPTPPAPTCEAACHGPLPAPWPVGEPEPPAPGHAAADAVWYGLQDGLTWSGVNWVQAEHLRMVPPQEMTPLSPYVEDKHILIELSRQWLTCFEGQDAVFDTRLSSGMQGMVTPQGTHRVLQKVPTTRMIGGEGSGYYDLPGIAFVTYFTASGVAIHGSYWHNDYGRPRSHGCINVPTAASQWVYRWTQPTVPYEEQRVFADAQNATTIQVVY